LAKIFQLATLVWTVGDVVRAVNKASVQWIIMVSY